MHRNRYWLIDIKQTGVIKSRMIRLPLKHIHYQQLRREIKIFNRMCLVLPTVNHVAVIYREQMRALLKDPQCRPSHDPYEKLFFCYACEVLSAKISDEVIRRQLRRNLVFSLAPKQKIVCRRHVVWSKRQYKLLTTPIYKIFNDTFCNPNQPAISMETPWQIAVHGSYIKYYNQLAVVKRYAHAYTLQSSDTQTVTLKVATDKNDFDCSVSRGVITCKNLNTGESHTYAVRGDKVRLATSVCAKTDVLEIYITWQGKAKISLDGGLAQWLPVNDVLANQRLEYLVSTAYQSKFVTGERLRTRYFAAEKIVPSLNKLTLVIMVHQVEDFLSVWRSIDDYRRLARLFQGFNLVFLYSSTSSKLDDIVQVTISQPELTACQNDLLWLYFVDSTTTEPDALYFFTKMTRQSQYVPPASIPVGLKIDKTWPYVKTLTVTNTLSCTMTNNLVIPINFQQPTIVSAKGSVLTAVNLATGHTKTYVLPAVVHIAGEWLTTHVNVPLKVKLAGFETRQFSIIRQDSQSHGRLTKRELATALSEIQIHTDDKKLDTIFTKEVIDGEDTRLLSAVKIAYQNQDRKLLLAVLSERHKITVDVWQYLLTQLIGLRIRAGQIYLAPCVNIMGEFRIAFTCHNQKYNFQIQKKLPTSGKLITIEHGHSNG